MKDECESCFGEPISVYTNSQAVEDGILVPIRDPQALAAGMMTALTADVRAQPPRESLHRFEFEHVIDKYLSLLCPNN